VALMAKGGNAVDAAIGAAVLLGLCEPQMTGLGGDMFVLMHRPGDGFIGLNASGCAPAGLSVDDLRAQGHRQVPSAHPAAITIPGAVDGFCRLHAHHGCLPLDAILAPAIHYAEAGVPVAPRVSFDWALAADGLEPSGKKHFLPWGAAPAPGTLFQAPGQAEVLRRIAAEGRDGFYAGEVAADMLATLADIGGTHTEDDFAATACTYVEPVETTYRGHRLVELPPNGQGATALLLANMLETFDVAALDPFGPDRAHLEAEATKLAYDARNRFIADPAYTARLDHLLSRQTAGHLAALIDRTQVMADPARISEAVHRDTVLLTVVDRDRLAVSMIYSIFQKFGSGHASDRFGVLFHDRGRGFSLVQGHPNEAGPGKRPMHTIIPAILAEPDGSLMPFGVMGGPYQATGHVRILSNIADYGMTPQAAIDAPRCFAYEGALRIERGYSAATCDALAQLGHTLTVPEEPIGGAQAIRIDATTNVLQGASDPRKDGAALGY
ncbi:MAG: gamma-glutamyltransferase family protein, partial [Pseudomonadota bacterium]